MPIRRPKAVFIPKARADEGTSSTASIPRGLRNPTLKVRKCFDLSPDHLMRQCEKCKTGYRYETKHGATEHLRSKHSNIFGKDMMELSKGKNRRWVLSTERLIEEGWLRDVSAQDVSESSPQQEEQLLTVIRTTKPFAGGSQNSILNDEPQRPHLHQRLLPEYRARHTTAAESDRSRFPGGPSLSKDDRSSTTDTGQLRSSELLHHNEAICRGLSDYDRGGRETEQLARFSSGSDSVNSSEESIDDLDDSFLDLEVAKFRSWLLERAESENEQSTNSTPKSTSHSSSVSYSATSSTAAASRGAFTSGKRRRDTQGDEDERVHRNRRPAQDKPECKPTPRLACLFNKYDPMMYRSSSQTDKRFEICGTHDFQNMNKLYEHLKRVHSDQPLQCPRCTRTSFESSEELQAHQTAPEPCTLVPLNIVKRIQWITHDKRKALQSAISRRLRGCTDEEKWRFAYRWLFPDTNSEEIPCPYLQDPVISIVSSVVDDFEIRLRDLIRSSTDLNDLEGRIPMIRGQFLAQYGIRVNQVQRDHPSSPSLRTNSSSPTSERLAITTPPDVADSDQPYLGGNTDHDERTLSSKAQPNLTNLSCESTAQQDTPHDDPLLIVSSDLVWLQNEFVHFDNGMLGWNLNDELWNSDHVTANDMDNSLYSTGSLKDVDVYNLS
ncbi:hypothetical protein KCU95_g8516, partial [Aureobasidium melanogenum]